ncbi:MAG: hypothetical protein A2V90_03480 [Gammaproteobacteria bacterium RBG_16_57_12]|nr:MAG: hypothetical protein A2V90_03480 [Gammaproteobacteria bacterium RBG_16_57_12]
MEGLFDGLTITDFHGDAYRNIASLRESQDLFDDLTPSPEGWQAAIDLELSTKPRTYASHQPIIDRPFEEAAFNEAIRYPFTHWAKTRYSDGSFGVWYGTDSLVTSIHETVYHWRTHFLEDAAWHAREGVIGERKVYLVRCDAALLNYIPKVDAFPALIDPMPGGYHLTHQVGARIHHDGHPGLISRSARCEGEIYAIFNPQVLSNPRQLCYLTYRIEGGSVTIERQAGDLLMRI